MRAVVEHREEDELHEGVRVEQPPEVHDHPHGRRLDRVVLHAFPGLQDCSRSLFLR